MTLQLSFGLVARSACCVKGLDSPLPLCRFLVSSFSSVKKLCTFLNLSLYLGSWTAAAAAKSLQSCPTLCDPRDGSPPGFPVPGILHMVIHLGLWCNVPFHLLSFRFHLFSSLDYSQRFCSSRTISSLTSHNKTQTPYCPVF